MNYPVEYTVIAENEKIHIEGGADYWGLFNYLIGDYLRDAVLSETRSAVWSSAKKGSTEPLQNWFKNFKSMGIMGMIGYIYGIYHLGEKIDTYLSKKDYWPRKRERSKSGAGRLCWHCLVWQRLVHSAFSAFSIR